MMKNFKLGILALVLSLDLSAQTADKTGSIGRGCGTAAPGEAWDKWFNAKVKEFEKQVANGQQKVASYVIPVVVHVIHGGQSVGVFPNISQAQVNSEIPVLNNDYAGSGYGVGSLPPVFSTLVANCNVSFCLAKLDPNGNCMSEPGIDRVDYHSIPGGANPTSASSASALQTLFDNTIKPATIWSPSQYLNIWVSDAASSAQLLGYATFPAGSGLTGLPNAGSSTTDGVWVWSRSFGTVGSTSSPYNMGRTASHEIGHYLGLRHTWGDGTCATDYCNDTPPSQNANFGCPTHPYKTGVCSGNTTGEMFQNFMDYSDDLCLALFTIDQRTRIQTAMANGTFRSQLTASSATLCNIASSQPTALYSLSTNSACIDSVIQTANLSTGGPCPTYTWSVSPATGYSFMPGGSASLTANPSIKFKVPGFYTLTLIATNSVGTSSTVDYIDIYDCFDEVGVSENQLSSHNVMLVPNPSNGVFNLLTKLNSAQNLNVRVVNTLGQVVFEQRYNNVTGGSFPIDIGNNPPGIYTVSIEGDGQKLVKRLVLTR